MEIIVSFLRFDLFLVSNKNKDFPRNASKIRLEASHPQSAGPGLSQWNDPISSKALSSDQECRDPYLQEYRI
jgi:hypothetical protein